MVDFLGMMKQAAELKSKMEAMQAELEASEVEGVAGGGMVAVKLNGKGEMRGVRIDEYAAQAVRARNPGGPAGRRARRRPPQGRGADAGEDAERHRRPAAAAGVEAVLDVASTHVALLWSHAGRHPSSLGLRLAPQGDG